MVTRLQEDTDRRLGEFGNHLEKMIKEARNQAREVREEMKKKDRHGGLYEMFAEASESIANIYSDVQKEFYKIFPEQRKR